MPASRRAHVLAALVVATFAVAARAAENAPWTDAVVRYVAALERPDGGYAWPDQAESQLTTTFAAVGSLHDLGRDVPRKSAVIAFALDHHPQRGRKPEYELHGFEYEQVQTLAWLGVEDGTLVERVKSWAKPIDYLKRYERHGYAVFQQELSAFACRELLKLPTKDLSPAFVAYVEERRRPNGSFNNTRAADGADGHVINTLWGLRALHTLGRDQEHRDETVKWLQSCQRPDGGFWYQPEPAIGRVEDVVYTWAAVRSLKQLNAAPADRAACVRWLHSLWNADGGFGDRPGWPSNPLATYYAIDALAALDALADAPEAPKPPPPAPPLPDDLKVFTIQIEAPGKGSPADAVELARSLGIHLWGAKNADPGWVEACQKLADERKVPVTFFVADEEYGTFVDVPGFGTYSHISDIVAPPGRDFGRTLAGNRAWTWAQFLDRRVTPLEKAGGRLIWQFGENEPLCRALLDESIERGTGYAAVSTFHFGNPDFILSQPFLYHYRHRLPLIGLQDNHAAEPWWWADQLTGFRTLFLAREPTWDGFLNAMKHNWVVAVRHDAVTQFRTRTHGGAPGVQAFVKAHEAEWRWWGTEAGRRPEVLLTALTLASDAFEAGRPNRGVALRVRCRWDNTTQGLPKRAVVSLVSLTVDGQTIKPEVVTRRNDRGALADIYHLAALPELPPGRHTATAVVRPTDGGAEVSQSIEFTVLAKESQ